MPVPKGSGNRQKKGNRQKEKAKRVEINFSTGREMSDSKFTMRIYPKKGRKDVPFFDLIREAVENFYDGLFYAGFNNDPIRIDASKVEAIKNVSVTLYARSPYDGSCDLYCLVPHFDPVTGRSNKVMFCYLRR